MKKILLILCFLVLSLNAYCQEDTLSSSRKGKFALHTSYKLGFSQLNSLTYKNLNGNVEAGEMLASYGFSKNATVSTGIALMNFNANIFDGGFQNLKNQYLQFPLKLSLGYGLGNKRTSTTQVIIGTGALATYHLKSSLESGNTTVTANNLTWSVGMLFDIGLEFSVFKDLNVGIGIESQFGDATRGDNHKMNLTNSMFKFSFIYKP